MLSWRCFPCCWADPGRGSTGRRHPVPNKGLEKSGSLCSDWITEFLGADYDVWDFRCQGAEGGNADHCMVCVCVCVCVPVHVSVCVLACAPGGTSGYVNRWV